MTVRDRNLSALPRHLLCNHALILTGAAVTTPSAQLRLQQKAQKYRFIFPAQGGNFSPATLMLLDIRKQSCDDAE